MAFNIGCLCYNANAMLGTYMQRFLTTGRNPIDSYEATGAQRCQTLLLFTDQHPFPFFPCNTTCIFFLFLFLEKTPVPYIGWVKMAPLQLFGWALAGFSLPKCPHILAHALGWFSQRVFWMVSGSLGLGLLLFQEHKGLEWDKNSLLDRTLSRQAPLSLTRPDAWTCPQEPSFSKYPTKSVYQGSPTLDIWSPSISEQMSHPLPFPWRYLISLAHLSKNPVK